VKYWWGWGLRRRWPTLEVPSPPCPDTTTASIRRSYRADATNDCLDKGQRCIAHCLVSFKEGDVELADYAAKVHEMQAVCGAFSYLLSANSEYVKAYASVCEQVCKDCEKECMKHKEHIECKACGEACVAVVDQIKLSLA
jgi:Cys-rich four helix bundle protein (predicted Tat secretion target)